MALNRYSFYLWCKLFTLVSSNLTLQPLSILSSFGAGHLPHVSRSSGMISLGLIGNQEERLRDAMTGKTGPNPSLDDGRFMSVSGWMHQPL